MFKKSHQQQLLNRFGQDYKDVVISSLISALIRSKLYPLPGAFESCRNSRSSDLSCISGAFPVSIPVAGCRKYCPNLKINSIRARIYSSGYCHGFTPCSLLKIAEAISSCPLALRLFVFRATVSIAKL